MMLMLDPQAVRMMATDFRQARYGADPGFVRGTEFS